ncbi:MAG: hypothetical protein ACD_81C00007G0005 [uncultured bacterium]|uniref:Uncharacterized protein n=1 Tax=Candidatus Wolfebacteria bacterium GW2011_GWC2_39_22 TaxID=1619013 RepID=A0A0G0QRK7_9BACT|nr:MAG: hypothetical protein ACD_81C00007G0005 [uncultured bacterium]KKR13010.1 MAG: hypothetical protein UT41_C0001G0554 [Candidatus Wolfebacteria bacterium GW2011_GWC2_39_22]HBG34565.1 AAA family ATPase [Holosporales bacterium]
MIVYQATKENFLKDVSDRNIEDIVLSCVQDKLKMRVGQSERDSWKNSLKEMYFVLNDTLIPNDSGVAIEYRIPQTSKRIDFILTGQDKDNVEQVILIELKQWDKVQLTEKDAIVVTRFKSGLSEENHPSYQAWSYASLINGFNQTVYEEKIQLNPCAYLHNYIDDGIITNPFYSDYIAKAPIFLKNDKEKLREFIKKYVKYGDKKGTIYRIDSGKIKPSKSLANSLSSMLKGNNEFVMIDDQKIVYETTLGLAKRSSVTNKNVLIVEGGPGTGKSVVAINLLVALTKLGLNCRYVTKNSAPRDVYESMLTGDFKKSEISNMFSGSGAFTESEENTFDALIIDEAHRLNEKSGMFKNLGENQVKEIIQSSKFAIFFIDEDQKVTWSDIGAKEEIIKWADAQGARAYSLSLSSQFRCNGSDGYLAWLDDVLGIRETANTILDQEDYDFRVVSSPNDLKDLIFEKNKINNKARIVAGYCWDWVSKKNPSSKDIAIPEYNFEMKWNLATDGNLWILKPESVSEIGCIHTCQGLDMDYVGVIIGPDLIVRDNEVITDPSKRAKTDASLKGYKKGLKENPEITRKRADAIIKNTYRTLMTRGMKGCYVYFTDKETEKFFRDRIGNISSSKKVTLESILSPRVEEMISIPLVGSVPCGTPLFAEENIEKMISVEKKKIQSGMKYFILRASGDSMNEAGINDGDLILCKQKLTARENDLVVALIDDSATVKEFHRDGNKIILKPRSKNTEHQSRYFTEGDDFKIQGIVQEVIRPLEDK